VLYFYVGGISIVFLIFPQESSEKTRWWTRLWWNCCSPKLV